MVVLDRIHGTRIGHESPIVISIAACSSEGRPVVAAFHSTKAAMEFSVVCGIFAGDPSAGSTQVFGVYSRASWQGSGSTRMALPKSTAGLMSVLVGLVLTRAALHYSRASAGMAPLEIWRAMTAGAKALVLAGFVLVVYGCWMVLVAVWKHIGRGAR